MVAPRKDVSEILYMWSRVVVWDGMLVEATIVTAGSPVTGGLLGDHVEGRSPTTRGQTDDTQFQHPGEFLPCYL